MPIVNTELISNSDTVPLVGPATHLQRGQWQISLDTSDALAVVTLQKKLEDATDYGVLGTVSLTTTNSFAVVESVGELFQGVRAGGSGAVSLEAQFIRY